MKSSFFQIALLCTFAALAAVGVLFFALFQIKGSTASTGAVTLWGTFDEPTIQKMLTDLGDKYPDLKNITYVQKDSSTYQQELTDALASGEAPDLFFVTDSQAYAQRNRLRVLQSQEVSASLFAQTFVDGAAPFVTLDGVLALPIVVDPLVLYWNKDLLTTAGFPKPPENWGPLLEYVKAITKKTDAGTLTVSTVAFGGYRNVDHAKEILGMLIAQAGGEVTRMDTSGLVSSTLGGQSLGASAASAASAASVATRFYTDFADPSRPEYTWNNTFPNSQKAFTSNQLALYLGRVSDRAAIKAANPNLNFDMAPMPQIQDTKKAVDGGRVYAIAIPKAAHNQVGALQILIELASSDVSSAFSQTLGLPSARRDVLDVQRRSTDYYLALAADEATILHTWFDPDPVKTDQIFQAMIDSVISNAMTLSEALSRAEQQIDNLSRQ